MEYILDVYSLVYIHIELKGGGCLEKHSVSVCDREGEISVFIIFKGH